MADRRATLTSLSSSSNRFGALDFQTSRETYVPRDDSATLDELHKAAIILDEGGSPESHPLRNALYAHCGLFRNSYDQAMRDESLRLAYVAVTRGVSRVIWYSGKR
jgi:ATP-dependent exoDNAse (exonuclease V) beta subunit